MDFHFSLSFRKTKKNTRLNKEKSGCLKGKKRDKVVQLWQSNVNKA